MYVFGLEQISDATPSREHSNEPLFSDAAKENVAVVSSVNEAGWAVTIVSGGEVSIVQWYAAGVPSTLPD